MSRVKVEITRLVNPLKGRIRDTNERLLTVILRSTARSSVSKDKGSMLTVKFSQVVNLIRGENILFIIDQIRSRSCTPKLHSKEQRDGDKV